MSAKYFVFAGGRWCEVDTRSGQVSGWRARARFCFVRGQRLHAARSVAVLRALRALAAGAPAAVRDAAPLPRCPRPRRPDRSRSRRRSSCRPLAHAPCCAHNHSRCDVNANELKSNPPATAVASPRKLRRASSEQEIRVLESVPKYAINENQASPKKSPQKPRHIRQSSSEEVEQKPSRKPVTRTRQSSQQHVNVVVLDKNATCSSSSDESDKPTRGKTSPTKAQKLMHKRHSSSVEEIGREPHKPATRMQKSQRRNVVVLDENTSSTTTSSEEPQISKFQKQSRYRRVLEISSTDAVSDDKPPTPKTRLQPQRQASRHADVIIVDDDSNHRTRVKTSKSIPPKVVTVSDSSREENKTKSHDKVRKVPIAEKLLKHLLETSEDEATGEESERAGTEKDPTRCKELIIGETDVETLRRFVKERGGRDKLKRFDRDERYKLRIFHRFNPLVSLERCQPLENLLRQRLTLKEFARNLGLRSVAEVTPEKRYRIRRSTKNARNVTSDTDEKEIVAKPKRRRLWNNDNAMFNSVSESISSEMPKAKPQIIKPAVNRDSSVDFSDSDAEFKRKVREQLAKTRRTGISELKGTVKEHTKPTGTSTPFKENVKPNNSSSAKVAEMLDSSEDEPRQTRSNKNATTVKPQSKVVSENDKLKSAKVNRVNDEIKDVRQTRSSMKVESPIKPKQSKRVGESISVVKSKAISKTRESSERVVRNTRSSNVAEIPARTLKEQNKKVSSDSESAFESSKRSSKKAYLIRKGKVSSNAHSPNKKGKDDGSDASDEDSARAKENKKKSATEVTVKPVKFKKSSVANGREYKPLEDHAIVAWVCGGHQRECRVNGNRLWRELALEYRRLTGQDRSWHSLRNRYLRYVLPALGALALPPAQVSRLRAAAAAGEIKSRGAKQRRNSIFIAPAVRSASGALRDRKGKGKEGEQSEREQRSKTDAKEQKEREVSKEQSKQKGGTRTRGEVGRGAGDAPTPKIEPPTPAPRVTRSSAGSPSRGNRHK